MFDFKIFFRPTKPKLLLAGLFILFFIIDQARWTRHYCENCFFSFLPTELGLIPSPFLLVPFIPLFELFFRPAADSTLSGGLQYLIYFPPLYLLACWSVEWFERFKWIVHPKWWVFLGGFFFLFFVPFMLNWADGIFSFLQYVSFALSAILTLLFYLYLFAGTVLWARESFPVK
ncbi:MAG: hypothetical protein HY917_03910 [Candidatus Diapherotrites archaeon]|nr:hypothetical protein [Candidatus Diapherotrites archaeon]